MINVPSIKLLVDREYITDSKESGLIEAYLVAVDCRNNSIIRFTVYLSSGALWSGLPISALWCDRFNEVNLESKIKETEKLQPFSCLEGPPAVITYNLLKNNKLTCKLGEANYLFTINYEGDGLSEDPEQYKTHNIIVLKSGQLAAYPNNYIRFEDNWFTNETEDVTLYKRNKKHFFPGG